MFFTCVLHRLVNLGDLGPDALATFDAANESSNAAEDDDDEDDEDAVLHPVSQMMFPLDESKCLIAVRLTHAHFYAVFSWRR
jgi:hypothetical protein